MHIIALHLNQKNFLKDWTQKCSQNILSLPLPSSLHFNCSSIQNPSLGLCHYPIAPVTSPQDVGVIAPMHLVQVVPLEFSLSKKETFVFPSVSPPPFPQLQPSHAAGCALISSASSLVRFIFRTKTIVMFTRVCPWRDSKKHLPTENTHFPMTMNTLQSCAEGEQAFHLLHCGSNGTAPVPLMENLDDTV